MKLAGKNILVTGGAGFIGSNLVDRIILENPNKLIVVDNFFLGKEENLKEAEEAYPELQIFRLDASDLAAMRSLTEDEQIEVVFDLAVVPLPTSLKYPAWTVNTNYGIALTFCELARAGVIGTLIHCSSSEAYGSAQYVPMDEAHPMKPRTPYAASKSGGDELIMSYRRTFGIDVAIARPFNNFGPRQNPGRYAGIIPIVVKKVKSGEPMQIFGDGEQTRDYIYVKDTVEALIKLYENEKTRGQAINVATGQEITMNTLVAKLLKVMGVPNYPVVHTDPRPGDVRRHCGDISLMKEVLGFQPAVISDEALQETAAWYMGRL